MPSILSFPFYLFVQVYLFILREKESSSRGGAEREGERKSQAGPHLSVWSLMQGSNSQTVRSWPGPKSRAEHLTDLATQVPWVFLFKEDKDFIKQIMALREDPYVKWNTNQIWGF